ncbi:unnamed protein product [Darwinula stevensoni]|uniref:Uncharacterized protein n=1 Tax=Darwinula stevensoni TaxID=69355 RepID=A0A7R9AAU1_9CRUS|nr:unnamed protein product [Darwinula stevensoni]CAG0898439.1 unnamed protein product [Darwinula stevensoni]
MSNCTIETKSRTDVKGDMTPLAVDLHASPSNRLIRAIFLWTGERAGDWRGAEDIAKRLRERGLWPKGDTFLPSLVVSLVKVIWKNSAESESFEEKCMTFLSGFFQPVDCTEVQLMRWINKLKLKHRLQDENFKEIHIYNNYPPCFRCCTMLLKPEYDVLVGRMRMSYRAPEEEGTEFQKLKAKRKGAWLFRLNKADMEELVNSAIDRNWWKTMERQQKVHLLYTIFYWTGEQTQVIKKEKGLIEFLKICNIRWNCRVLPEKDKYLPHTTICMIKVKTFANEGNSTLLTKAFWCGIFDFTGKSNHVEMQLLKWIEDKIPSSVQKKMDHSEIGDSQKGKMLMKNLEIRTSLETNQNAFKEIEKTPDEKTIEGAFGNPFQISTNVTDSLELLYMKRVTLCQ